MHSDKLSSAGIIFAQCINVPTKAVNTNFATAGIIFAHCINAPTTAVDSVPSHDMKQQGSYLPEAMVQREVDT